MSRKQISAEKRDPNIPDYLNEREYRFINEYLISNKVKESAIIAGYPKSSAASQGSRFLASPRAKKYIEEKRQKTAGAVATSEEILEYLTAVMRGQVLDSFGIEASISDRTKAANALADRLIDSTKVSGQVTIINNIPRGDVIVSEQ